MNRVAPLLLFALLFLATLQLIACAEAAGPALQNLPTASAEPIATAVQPTAVLPTPTAVPDVLAVTFADTHALDDFPASAPLVLHFNQPMNPSRTGVPLLLSPAISGDFAWSDNHQTLTFTPRNGFRSRALIVSVHASLRSQTGLRLPRPQRWQLQFRTAPKVANRQPRAESINSFQPPITVRFNRPMDPDSVAAALSLTPPLPYQLTWQTDTLHIALQEELAFGTDYTFVLAKTAVDTTGNPLLTNVEWRYRLQDTVAKITVPTAASHQAPYRIQFNYPMNTASVEQLLHIDPPIDLSFAWNDDQTAVTLTPASQLPPDTAYTLAFAAALRHASGRELPPPSPFTFTTPPPIVATLPMGQIASPWSMIAITFDRAMDQATTAAAFQLEPAVEGSLEWQNNTLSFLPENGRLAAVTDYTVTLAPTALAADGQTVHCFRKPIIP